MVHISKKNKYESFKVELEQIYIFKKQTSIFTFFLLRNDVTLTDKNASACDSTY